MASTKGGGAGVGVGLRELSAVVAVPDKGTQLKHQLVHQELVQQQGAVAHLGVRVEPFACTPHTSKKHNTAEQAVFPKCLYNNHKF